MGNVRSRRERVEFPPLWVGLSSDSLSRAVSRTRAATPPALRGLRDRIEALEGTLEIESSPDAGTR